MNFVINVVNFIMKTKIIRVISKRLIYWLVGHILSKSLQGKWLYGCLSFVLIVFTNLFNAPDELRGELYHQF
jgi:hypothetical protein